MKRIVSLLLSLTLLLSLSGCSSDEENRKNDVKSTDVPVSAVDVTPTDVPVSDADITPTEVPVSDVDVTPTEVPVSDADVTPTEVPVSDADVTPTEVPVSDTGVTPTATPVPDVDVFTLGEQLEGIYQNVNPGEADEHLIQISFIGGTLLVENNLFMEGSLYSYWVQELRPMDTEVLYGTAANVIDAPNLAFSIQSFDGNYWVPFSFVSLALTSDGVTITEAADGQSIESVFVRVDDAEDFHVLTDGLLEMVSQDYTDIINASPVGDWYFADSSSCIWLSIREDGSFLSATKVQSEPVKVDIGAWCTDSQGNLSVVTQRLGSGTMPYMSTLNWSLKADIDGALVISDPYGGSMIPGEGSYTLQSASPDWRFPNGLYPL